MGLIWLFMSTRLNTGRSEMQHVVINRGFAPSRRMTPLTTTPDRADQQLTGQALRQIRERQGLKQPHVAAALGMSTQAWQKYEAGERRWSDEKIAQVLESLDATPEELENERARILGTPLRTPGPTSREFVVDVYGRARAGPQGPEVYDVAEPLRSIDLRQLLGQSAGAMQVFGDSMVPWAEPGEVVLFDRESYPRRGGGCIVELHDGSAFVKLYERSDGSTLFVRELFPEERVIKWPLREVKGVYAVKLRGD